MYKSQNIIIILIFLLIGIITFQSYGISWDEPEQRKIGMVNYNYVFDDDDTLLTWYNNDYGPVFELVLVTVEKIFNLSEFRTIYLTRHILIHLLFLFSVYIFSKIIFKLYNSRKLASIGSLMLLLHPRIYGHSFFNSKDIPFLSLIIVCTYLFLNIIENRKWYKIALLGIFIGIAINIRIIGIYIPFLFTLYIFIYDVRRKRIVDTIQLIAILLLSISFTVFAIWPYLWSDSIFHIKSTIKNMSQFRWYGDLLFFGEYIKGSELPWTYLPTWFLLTTPLTYLLFGLIGIASIFFLFIKNSVKFITDKVLALNLLFVLLFLAPVIAIILFKSVVYDGWRHIYFIYPFFVLISIFAFQTILKSKVRYVATALLILTFARISYFYIINIPLEHVYFNSIYKTISDNNIEENFEMDYWGLSYRQALEYLNDEIESDSIKVHFKNTPGELNLAFLPKEIQSNFIVSNFNDANFYISNFRQRDSLLNNANTKLFHTIKVGKYPVNKIYRLDN